MSKGPIFIDIPPTDLNSHFAPPELRETMRKTWQPQLQYFCKKCQAPPFEEPSGLKQWGCFNCRFTTINPSLYFERKAESGEVAA